ncbi:M20/M25/M40 family metallo-hydrolase [Blautia stercoris]
MNETFLTNLLSSISVSGYEEPVQEVVEAEMKNYADEIRRDEMQNLTCVLNPDSDVRIMLSAHADEIGLMISNIREDGRLQVIDRGGIVPATYPGRQVRIKTKNGEVYGVVEAYRSLFKDENLGTKQFLIDIGAKDKEDALNYVSLGDPIVPDTPIRKLANGKFTARALDDRLGVYIIMEALKRAKELDCKVGIYAASTTGEETTKTGAYWTSARIQPTMAIVVDVTYTSDCSGMDPAEMGTVCLGEGPVLCNSPIVVKALNEKMEECAKKAGISVQREAASRLSYTDGDQIHFSNQGVPMVLVSIPLRYMHMPAEVADEKDVEGCIELIAQFLAGYQG